MPDKIDKELKRKFGAYLKVAILNAKKEYLIELNKIIKTETSLDEVDSIEDKAAERMLENVCIDYKIKDLPVGLVQTSWSFLQVRFQTWERKRKRFQCFQSFTTFRWIQLPHFVYLAEPMKRAFQKKLHLKNFCALLMKKDMKVQGQRRIFCCGNQRSSKRAVFLPFWKFRSRP